jgi:glycosyltransferase involved in cell wall biosynthesis
VVLLGDLPHCSLRFAYEAATAFVFPSYLESFGHPMVEAMSFGLPVVAADTPVNREICGEAAVYHPPFDVGDLACRIVQAVTDQAMQDRLRTMARERARLFSWDRHVRLLLQALKGR